MKDATIEDLLPLAPLQEGLWYHSSYDESGADVYLGQWMFEFDAALDEQRLEGAARELLRRNASLRASFVQRRSGELVQVVVGEVPTPMTVVELGDRELAEVQRDERARRFDLAKAPLLRLLLVRRGEGRHALIMTVHHIVMDGWSASLLIEELFDLYASEPATLPARRPYRDYLAWLAGQDHDEAETAWRAALAEVSSPCLVAPADGGESPELAEFVELDLSAELTSELIEAAARHSVTLNIVVQAAWAIVLAQQTARKDIVLGVTVSGRSPELDGVEEMIGLFINTVPVCARIAGDTTLAELLHSLQDEQARLISYPYVGLSAIQKLAGLGRLFDTTFVFQNQPGGGDVREIEPGLTASLTDARDYNSFALSLQVTPGERLRLEVGYQAKLFERADVETLARQLHHVLDGLTGDPMTRIGDIPSLPRAQYDEMVERWNDTERPGLDTTLSSLFEARVRDKPKAVAISVGEESLTYAELNARANQLAHRFIADGEGPGRPIALLLPRSIEMVVAMLAAIKAGAGYIAMDPDDPTERLVVMLNDASPTSMVTMDDYAQRFSGLDMNFVALGQPRTTEEIRLLSRTDPTDADRTAPLDAREVAYVAYTSGSTGVPKGITVTHENVASLVLDERWREGKSDRVFAHSPQAFDATTYEVWVPLSIGGQIVMNAPGRFDQDDAARTIRDGGATSAYLTARLFNALVEENPGCLVGLREIWTGAETASPEVFRTALDKLPGVDLINVYGPTETTVFATRHVVRGPDAIGNATVSVGRALDNSRVYVLDDRMRPCPPGALGEIYIGGPRVARGYLGRPRLTSERFVCDPFGPPGTRMYRTGDLGWWHADGRLEFGGRSDHQAKIRGFRIEPAEVEAALTRQDEVAAAAVVVAANGSGEKVLNAYVVARSGLRIEVSELLARLARSLPRYMVPDGILVLDRLPLTDNGKLDRGALPDVQRAASATGREPRSKVESTLCTIWEEVLGVERVSIDDDFFELGGESLAAIRVVNRVRSELSSELAIQQLFLTPRIVELADGIGQQTPARPALRRRAAAG
ncbi:MAG: non-ribosomal peptide synthetase [Pseudonocardiales bacterium]|nr:MAG: non-ribosomal peptide synthetase [Pseudonocardiales bacterium]